MQTSAAKMIHRRSTVLLASFVVMMVISIYQYSWFLFAYAIESEWNWDLAVIGLVFTSLLTRRPLCNHSPVPWPMHTAPGRWRPLPPSSWERAIRQDRQRADHGRILWYLGSRDPLFVRFADVLELFILAVFLAALLGGAPFALYPATIGDYYGARYSTTNYGITYTAKAWAGLISGWLSGYLVVTFGSYKIPLVLVAFGSLAAALSHPRQMRAPIRKGDVRG